MSQSIGKILDELLAGTITKQEAVTKLQRNRNRRTKVKTRKVLVWGEDYYLQEGEIIKTRTWQQTKWKAVPKRFWRTGWVQNGKVRKTEYLIKLSNGRYYWERKENVAML